MEWNTAIQIAISIWMLSWITTRLHKNTGRFWAVWLGTGELTDLKGLASVCFWILENTVVQKRQWPTLIVFQPLPPCLVCNYKLVETNHSSCRIKVYSCCFLSQTNEFDKSLNCSGRAKWELLHLLGLEARSAASADSRQLEHERRRWPRRELA